MPTSIGLTSAVLQPDFEFSWDAQGSRGVANYKGSLTAILAAQPQLGDDWDLTDIAGYPDSMIVIGVTIKSVGGGDAVMTVIGAADYREELSWQSIEKAIELHPKVQAALTNAQIVAVKQAMVKDKSSNATGTPARDALASGQQKYLYDILSKRVDGFLTRCPVYVKTTIGVATYTSPLDASGEGGVVLATPIGLYITLPTVTESGQTIYWVGDPGAANVDNGIYTHRRTYTGYPYIETWMYDSGTAFPSAS
jgi:hypothetical protein